MYSHCNCQEEPVTELFLQHERKNDESKFQHKGPTSRLQNQLSQKLNVFCHIWEMHHEDKANN